MKMSRFLIIKPKNILQSVLLISFLLSFCATPVVFASSPANDWPMFHNDLTHTGYSNSTPTATSAKLLWNYTTDMIVWASPAVVDGCVYIGSDGGIAYCLNASDGSKIWSYTVPAGTFGPVGAGGPPIGSSMAVADGYVYFGCYDGSFYCLNAATGDKVWNFTTGATVESCPAVANGYVYVGSWDGNVYCLDALTGAKIWNYTAGGLVESSPAVVDGRVYVASTNFNVYCLDAFSGAEIWTYTTGNIVQSSPTVVNGYVYIGSEDNNVYCLSASDGSKIWNYTTPGWVDSSPAVANGYVYVGSWVLGADSYDIASDVYCLDASTGTKVWNYTTHGGVNSSPAVAGSYVYVGGWDGNFYCLDIASGAEVWSYATGSHVNSSPALAGGVVYVGSWDHKVYAFGDQLASPVPSPSVPEFPVQVVAVLAVSFVLVTLTFGIAGKKWIAKKN
jgi:eukaryotic-like serine/threonine-protein kinase